MLVFSDDDKLLYIDTNASHLGCGAMLYQYDVTGTKKLPLRFMAHVF